MRTIHLKSVQFNGRDKFYMRNFAQLRTKSHFFVYVSGREKITAKVNAFMLPDGEVDLNFQKGGS